jgi:hypothetical protein
MADRIVRSAPLGATTGQMPDPPGGRDELQQEKRSHPKVVAHFLDGRILRGFALDFRPSQETFLLTPWDAVDPATTTRICLAELKALFFVKAFKGTPANKEAADAARSSLLGGQVTVRFRDGEVLRGTSPSRDPGGTGFFLVPMDPRSNNRRIYVLAKNGTECRFESEGGT